LKLFGAQKDFEADDVVASFLRQVQGSDEAPLPACRDHQTPPKIPGLKGHFTIRAELPSQPFPFLSCFHQFLGLSRCRRGICLFVQQKLTARTSQKSAMWLSTSLSALWLAACALADPSSTDADGIRSIPVSLFIWSQEVPKDDQN
jgi:hypothetical protein